MNRIECQLIQEDLAQKVGITRQTIGGLDNGRYNPGLKRCVNIARVLNKTLDELFWEESIHD
ncbi:MAG: helix-turn-helix transcriptional regulator [Sporolactobacillus sp.]